LSVMVFRRARSGQPQAIHFYDAQTMIVADQELMEKFLSDNEGNRQPAYQSQPPAPAPSEEETPAAPGPGGGMMGGGMMGGPPGGGMRGGLRGGGMMGGPPGGGGRPSGPPQMPTGGAAGGAPGGGRPGVTPPGGTTAAPVVATASYLTVKPAIKTVMD